MKAQAYKGFLAVGSAVLAVLFWTSDPHFTAPNVLMGIVALIAIAGATPTRRRNAAGSSSAEHDPVIHAG